MAHPMAEQVAARSEEDRMGRPDLSQLRETVATLSDPQWLAGLEGADDHLDSCFGLVGADDVAQILARGLPNIFQTHPSVFARIRDALDAIPMDSEKTIPDANRKIVARLLAEIINSSDEMTGDINYLLHAAILKSTAAARRKDESTFWTRIEDNQHEKILFGEYSGIEAQLFNRLKNRIPSCILDRATTRKNCDLFDGTSETKEAVASINQVSDGLRHFPAECQSNLLSWTEMQVSLAALDPNFSVEDSVKEPLRTLLWISQHGTQEQWFAHLYSNAEGFDEELRKAFLEALEGDQAGQVPTVWKTILIRALSRSLNSGGAKSLER